MLNARSGLIKWFCALSFANKLHTMISDQVIIDNVSHTGFSLVPKLLTPALCSQLRALFDDPSLFRSVIDMQRYRFGQGMYKYFQYPLPAPLQELRTALYGPLAMVANTWMEQLDTEQRYPSTLETFLELCHQKGQQRPTPLILRYEAGGYNTLHQDLYGDVYFPFQVVILLSEEGRDFSGGEFVMTEQIPRAQSRAHVLRPGLGDGVIFTTNFRPVRGTRGYYRATMKHGVSALTSGVRYATGIIFHDAK